MDVSMHAVGCSCDMHIPPIIEIEAVAIAETSGDQELVLRAEVVFMGKGTGGSGQNRIRGLGVGTLLA